MHYKRDSILRALADIQYAVLNSPDWVFSGPQPAPPPDDIRTGKSDDAEASPITVAKPRGWPKGKKRGPRVTAKPRKRGRPAKAK